MNSPLICADFVTLIAADFCFICVHLRYEVCVDLQTILSYDEFTGS